MASDLVLHSSPMSIQRTLGLNGLSKSYTMGCPPVRGDNPRALASELSYVQVDKHGITIYTTYISLDLAHNEKFRTKVGKGGIKSRKCKVFENLQHLLCVLILTSFGKVRHNSRIELSLKCK